MNFSLTPASVAFLLFIVLSFFLSAEVVGQTVDAGGGPVGYYRSPAIHGDTIVFAAEGDLWKVSSGGGTAHRLTTHHGNERYPAISPDGLTLAFTAQYEGPSEVYTMPIDGGLPVRQTCESDRGIVSGWAPDGRVLYATHRYSTLPDRQLVLLDIETGARELVPLAQAAEGSFDESGTTLFFTRVRKQGSHTKRYKGGTAQNIWRFSMLDEVGREAVPLTSDYVGTSRRPMYWDGRVYFLSDRDDTMNLWSMLPDGSDCRQHTHHVGWDVKSPSLGEPGLIVYQLGADLRVYDILTDRDRLVSITLNTDFDQMREKWVTDPMSWLSSVSLSPNGDRVVLTARGEVFVAPHKQGRIVQATRRSDVRYRRAMFMPDGDSLLTLSDESDEVEFWELPVDGVGERKQLTEDGEILRWYGVPSPDCAWIAHHDKNRRLWIYNYDDGSNVLIDESGYDRFSYLSWSPDSRWLAYVKVAHNLNHVIRVYNVETGETFDLTSDRYDSKSPVWGADGEWIYFLSDRHFVSLVRSPWGPRQPEPFFDRTTRMYMMALQDGLRSPFRVETELTRAEENEDTPDDVDDSELQGESGEEESEAVEDDEDSEEDDGSDEKSPPVEIEIDGIADRLELVPVEPGNYSNLFVTEDRLFFSRVSDLHDRQRDLMMLKIDNQKIEVKMYASDISLSEVSLDYKMILVRQGNALHIVSATGGAPAKLDGDSRVDLSGWAFSLIPREEWRQMFIDAWRLERDYFYDPDMHGVDWPGMLDKYLPLVDRVSNRGELSDLIAQMVSELSALHIYVYGGDHRSGDDHISIGTLGARLKRDADAGGYRIGHIYQHDPDEPQNRSPLADPSFDISENDVIQSINGIPVLSVNDIGLLLRNQVGRQVLLDIQSTHDDRTYHVVVEPISTGSEWSLRYDEWEYTRRLAVEEKGDGEIGYVHLRAMNSRDYGRWVRDFYPVFDRPALIIDVRHNGGGNTDSWILEKLLRKAWFYWQGRHEKPTWNMQYAFRGHIVVLCDEKSGSDAEAFTEGFRRLGLGTVIGTRTWGGEIWLSSSNRLVDRGIATAAETGVYGPEGEWFIEGHGVDPDIVVDNLPHATFNGSDAQLDAAVDYLLRKLEEEPILVPEAPLFPDKSSGDNTVG